MFQFLICKSSKITELSQVGRVQIVAACYLVDIDE